MGKFKNLDEVELYLKENAPDWSMRRGKQTDNVEPERWRTKHANGYEVIQVYKPGEFRHAFAEFWKGYEESFPEGITGLCSNNGLGCFRCIGDPTYVMEYIMRRVHGKA